MKTLIVIISVSLAWTIYYNAQLKSENFSLNNKIENKTTDLSNYKYALDKSVEYIRCLELKRICSDERERGDLAVKVLSD